MDYTKFKVEDFAADDLFIRWVLENDPEATRFWIAYLDAHPEVQAVADQARALLINLQRSKMSTHSPEQMQKMWGNIEAGVGWRDEKPRSFAVYRIAASIAAFFVASLGIWYVLQSSSESIHPGIPEVVASSDEYIKQVNNTGSTIWIRLSDGSQVALENESQLLYKRDYAADSVRQVYLEGEAFFLIARNQQQPFFVYANEVVTKVLGTSFRVKAYTSEESVVVSVEEGKVSVYSAKEKPRAPASIQSEMNGVVLSSNQQVLYNRSEDAFNKSLVDTPQIIPEFKKSTDFQFHNASIGEVFRSLESAYGVEIIFQEEVMQNCFLTVSLRDEPLFEKLKIICRTLGATYELIDAKIVINSKGC